MRSFTAIVAFLTLFFITPAYADDKLGLKLPKGFKVTKYADDSLAHDIHAMTIDTAGRVVVSGPGYVKILYDTDKDGVADRTRLYADGPKSGAQGLCFLGRDLICTGDAGLIRYRDDDKNDQADGPPQTFLRIKTGGEHNAHAIRRGPDGWWYLLAGNTAGVDESFVTQKRSAIRFPHGGVLLRLKPDLDGAEVLADGFRNAYDFDFNAQGDLFVYDSDGERELSLPSYRPSRLLHVLPGGEHGWITDNWKRPDYFADSAPVVADTGRSSPTGMLCYRHTQFPAEYRNGLFALDWTFGRILHIPLQRAGATWTGTPQPFLTSDGEFGFAPTDLDVGLDGSLYVCVGGRGTHGTVYRIAWTGAEKDAAVPPLLDVRANSPAEQQLAACLDAPMPQSSWSRARWLPLARKLGAGPLIAAAIDEARPIDARIRAIEIVTEVFDGLTPQAVAALSKSQSAEVRARAAWSLGTNPSAAVLPASLQAYLADADPLVKRCGVEAVRSSGLPADLFVPALAQAMHDPDRVLRLACARLVPFLESAEFQSLSNMTRRVSWRAALTNALGFVWRTAPKTDGFNAYGLELGRKILEGNHPPDVKFDAVRLLQLSLADVGPGGVLPPVFDAYASPLALKKYQTDLAPLHATLIKLFPTGQPDMDAELARLAAMSGLKNDAFADTVLQKLGADTPPVDDLHYLAVYARTLVKPDAETRTRVARALVAIDRKLAEARMPQDNTWKERVGELYGELVARDTDLPPAILDQPGFGRPSHVLFLSKLPEAQLPKATELFIKAAAADVDYAWNTDVIFVVGFDKSAEHFELVRQQYERHELRMAVLMVLSGKPHEEDRLKFAEGLDSGPIEVLSLCLAALEKLPAKGTPEENVSLVKLLRRLGADPSEYLLRERVVKLLQRNTNQEIEFEFGEQGHRPQPATIEQWTAYVTQAYPEVAPKILGAAEVSLPELKDRLKHVDWRQGDAERGRKLFASKTCTQCHAGSGGLGPDLAGATNRFARDDLFAAVAAPNLDVSPRYQSVLIETKQGKQHTGLVVYETVDALLLRNAAGQTFRIETADIASKRNLPTSVMPAGLLNGLKDTDLADLYRYMQSLGTQTAQSESGRKSR